MSAEMDKHILKEAAGAFATDGAAVSCERYGSGHINDTFRLICDSCSSDQRFSYSFLPIPPHDGHPCCSAIHFLVA